MVLGQPDPDWTVDAVGHDAVIDGEGDRFCDSTSEHLTESGLLSGRVQSVRLEFELGAQCDNTSVRNAEWNVCSWQTELCCEVASCDKGTSDGEDIRGSEGDIEGLGDRGCTVEDVKETLMSCFCSQNRSSRVEEDLVANDVRTTQVGSDTNLFHHASNGGHGGNIRKDWIEIKATASYWLSSEGFECLVEAIQDNRVSVSVVPQSGGSRVEYVHCSMCGLVALDVLEVLDGNIWHGNASGDEILSIKLVQGLSVELGLQLFKDLGKSYEDS